MEMNEEKLNELESSGGLYGYCAKILVRNYKSIYSPFNYHQIKYKSLVPHSLDHEFSKEPTIKDSKQPLDEYTEQSKVLEYMYDSDCFTTEEVLLMNKYFSNGYCFSETHRDICEYKPISYGWLHSKLNDIKSRIPITFKDRWKNS